MGVKIGTVYWKINDGQPCGVEELGKNEPLKGGHGPIQGQQAQGYGPPMSDLSTGPVFWAKFDLFKQANLSSMSNRLTPLKSVVLSM